jgi:hypothetical protein
LSLLPLLLVTILGVASVWGIATIVREIRRSREEATLAALLALFAPAAAEAREDPSRLLAWQPAAAIARRLFGPAMAHLDRAAGGTFPFSEADARDAHARWTAAWLAWERTHDEDCKARAAAAEARGGPEARAAIAAIEREKLERYQRRYEEYIRVGKGLKALFEPETGHRQDR